MNWAPDIGALKKQCPLKMESASGPGTEVGWVLRAVYGEVRHPDANDNEREHEGCTCGSLAEGRQEVETGDNTVILKVIGRDGLFVVEEELIGFAVGESCTVHHERHEGDGDDGPACG